MSTVAEVLTAHGICRPDITVRAAADAGLALPAACVVLEDETGGGRMIWGHDPVDPQGLYVPGGPVAEGQAREFVRRANAGTIGLQGIGDCQLTSLGYVNRAMELGGVWDPYANQRAGFEGLGRLIAAHGVQDGFRAYNGSGPAAEAYGRRSAAVFGTWTARLAGATATPTGGRPAGVHSPRRTMHTLPPTPAPADPNSDPGSWPQRNWDISFDVVGGWEGAEASQFGVQDWPGRTCDGFRGFLRLASWIAQDGRLSPVEAPFSTTGAGGAIMNHWPTHAWVAPPGTVGLTVNYAAPGGAYLTEGRSS